MESKLELAESMADMEMGDAMDFAPAPQAPREKEVSSLRRRASHSTNERTQAGTVRGKLAELSPEAARAEARDERSDVFSLGIMLYRALTGRHMFRGDNDFATLSALIAGTRPTPLFESVDGDALRFAALVTKATEHDPAARHTTLAEFVRELDAVLDTFAASSARFLDLGLAGEFSFADLMRKRAASSDFMVMAASVIRDAAKAMSDTGAVHGELTSDDIVLTAQHTVEVVWPDTTPIVPAPPKRASLVERVASFFGRKDGGRSGSFWK